MKAKLHLPLLRALLGVRLEPWQRPLPARAGAGPGRAWDTRCAATNELGSWSLTNLVKQEGERAIESIDELPALLPELDVRFYNNDELFAEFRDEELPAPMSCSSTNGTSRGW